MTEPLRAFLSSFGEALASGKLAADALASWLTVGQVTRQWRTWQERVATGWGTEPSTPSGLRVQLYDTTLHRLRDDFEDIPPDLTAANFRGWGRVTLHAEGEEFDAWADVWLAVVDEGGRLRIGYVVIGPAER